MLRIFLTLSTMALFFSGLIKTTQGAEFATAEEAKAMLSKVVTALKENQKKALEDFNSGNTGFRDRDLYVLCANASDGIITASPSSNGMSLNDFSPGKNVS